MKDHTFEMKKDIFKYKSLKKNICDKLISRLQHNETVENK